MNVGRMRRQVERAATDSRPVPPVCIVDIDPALRPLVNMGRNLVRAVSDAFAQMPSPAHGQGVGRRDE